MLKIGDLDPNCHISDDLRTLLRLTMFRKLGLMLMFLCWRENNCCRTQRGSKHGWCRDTARTIRSFSWYIPLGLAGGRYLPRTGSPGSLIQRSWGSEVSVRRRDSESAAVLMWHVHSSQQLKHLLRSSGCAHCYTNTWRRTSWHSLGWRSITGGMKDSIIHIKVAAEEKRWLKSCHEGCLLKKPNFKSK